MKDSLIIALLCLMIIACDKNSVNSEQPETPRQPSIPEQVEKEMLGILSHNWIGLADTINYFNENLLSRGQTSGFGPDSVWYELDVQTSMKGIDADFYVEDNLWLKAHGVLDPLSVNLEAFSTLVCIAAVKPDSLSIASGNIRVNAPVGFGTIMSRSAQLYYKEQKVGYLVIEELESEDYSVGNHIVFRYYDDNRSFSFYDNGFINLTGILNEFI